jgi:hypothetical protein
MFLHAVTISYLVRMLVHSTNIELPNVNLTRCVQRTKNAFFLVSIQLYYLTYQLHVSATVSSHHQTDPKNTERKKQYSSKFDGYHTLESPGSGPNMAAVLFPSFYILEIALVMATNSSRNMKLIC